jgi:hypothetical protein
MSSDSVVDDAPSAKQLSTLIRDRSVFSRKTSVFPHIVSVVVRPSFCLGYVAGIGALLEVNGSVVRQHPDPAWRNLATCPDPNARPFRGGYRQAFINWASENPQLWRESSGTGVIVALGVNWPCGPKTP